MEPRQYGHYVLTEFIFFKYPMFANFLWYHPSGERKGMLLSCHVEVESRLPHLSFTDNRKRRGFCYYSLGKTSDSLLSFCWNLHIWEHKGAPLLILATGYYCGQLPGSTALLKQGGSHGSDSSSYFSPIHWMQQQKVCPLKRFLW